jgi:hypothetical protein
MNNKTFDLKLREDELKALLRVLELAPLDDAALLQPLKMLLWNQLVLEPGKFETFNKWAEQQQQKLSSIQFNESDVARLDFFDAVDDKQQSYPRLNKKKHRQRRRKK